MILRAALVAFSLSSTKLAQALPWSKHLNEYVTQVWTGRDGLVSVSIRSIHQTRDGYIWFATDDGIVRFDGVTFTTYRKSVAPELKANWALTLYEDSNDVLWIGTYGGGVSRRTKDGKFSTFSTDNGLRSNVVRVVTETAQREIWIGYQAGGISRFADNKWLPVSMPKEIANFPVTSLLDDHKGAIWVATDGGGVWKRSGETWSQLLMTDGPTATDSILSIAQTRSGDLWFGAKNGRLHRMHGDLVSVQYLGPNFTYPIRTIFEDRDNSLWLGTMEGGLRRISPDGHIDSYATQDGLPGPQVFSIEEDREGNIWVGTISGLVRFKDGAFVTVDIATPSEKPSFTWGVREDDSGNLWITTTKGILRKNRDGWTRFTSKDGLAADLALGIEQDADGTMWFGSRLGVHRFKDGKFRTYTTADGLSHNQAFSLGRDAKGNLWIGALDAPNLFENGQFRPFGEESGMKERVVYAFTPSRTGNMWLATNDGLSLFKNGKFTSWTSKDGLSDDLVWSVYEDREGVVWLATGSGGLNRYSGGKFTSITVKNGLTSDSLWSVLEDDRGNLWMSSNEGVFRVAKSELNSFAQGRASSVTSISYGRDDGMRTSECSGGNSQSAWKSKDGRLWFATSEGVVVVDPSHLPNNKIAPPVLLESVLVNKSPLAAVDKRALVTLSHTSREFEFRYTALSFVAPSRVKFKYKLEGFDEDWVDAGSRRVAYYTNLSPGNYAFQVIACNNDGLWNEEGAKISFRIPALFYRQYPFYILVLFLVFGAGATLIRSRAIALQRTKLELEASIAQATDVIAEQDDELLTVTRIAEQIENHFRSMSSKGQFADIALLGRKATPSTGDIVDVFDVGKGASAAVRILLITFSDRHHIALAQMMAVRTVLGRVKRADNPGPGSFLTRLNAELFSLFPTLDVVCSAACFDITKSHISSATAGHPGPILFKSSSKTVLDIEATTSPLGMIKDASFAERIDTLQRNDIMLVSSGDIDRSRFVAMLNEAQDLKAIEQFVNANIEEKTKTVEGRVRDVSVIVVTMNDSRGTS